MLKDMKPVRGIQVGDLVRHKPQGGAHYEISSIWAGCTGIVIGLPKMYITDICSYPSIYWSDGRTGTAHRQNLEIISETKGERK